MFMQLVGFSGCTQPKTDSDKYGVPTLEDLGKNSKDCGPVLFPGGETEALDRMERMMKKTVLKILLYRKIPENCCNYPKI